MNYLIYGVVFRETGKGGSFNTKVQRVKMYNSDGLSSRELSRLLSIPLVLIKNLFV
jgi:hypothetical protein